MKCICDYYLPKISLTYCDGKPFSLEKFILENLKSKVETDKQKMVRITFLYSN